MSAVDDLEGERIDVPERLVVSGVAGSFHPVDPVTVTAEGSIVAAGDPVGRVEGPGTSVPILSPFDGFLMGHLARPGERVRPGQPVAWLRTF